MNSEKTPRPIAVEAASARLRARPSSYPKPFFSRMKKCEKRLLRALFGLTNFGVNLTRIKPSGESALLHPTANRTSLSLEGTPVLVTDQGKMALGTGVRAGFPAQGIAHQLVNRSQQDVVYLEIAIAHKATKAHIPMTTSKLCSPRTVGGGICTRMGQLTDPGIRDRVARPRGLIRSASTTGRPATPNATLCHVQVLLHMLTQKWPTLPVRCTAAVRQKLEGKPTAPGAPLARWRYLVPHAGAVVAYLLAPHPFREMISMFRLRRSWFADGVGQRMGGDVCQAVSVHRQRAQSRCGWRRATSSS